MIKYLWCKSEKNNHNLLILFCHWFIQHYIHNDIKIFKCLHISSDYRKNGNFNFCTFVGFV